MIQKVCRNHYSIFVLALVLIYILVYPYTILAQTKQTPVQKPPYSAEWKEVEALLAKGLPKSALPKITLIYNKAKTAGNVAQIIKAALYKIQVNEQINDNGTISNIYDLEQLLPGSTVPETNLLHSVLAELYWNYYQQHRYQILERTQIAGKTEPDIALWDASTMLDKIHFHFDQSLANSALLQAEPVSKYSQILNKGTAPGELRPSLYDFLAHRAIDFFMHSEAGLTQPSTSYVMDSELLFGSAKEFISVNITSLDSLNMNLKALRHLQALLQFRMQDNNILATLDADLKRLDFVYRESVNVARDTLYLRALQRLESTINSVAGKSMAQLKIAHYFFDHGNRYNRLQKGNKNRYDLNTAEKHALHVISVQPGSDIAKQAQALLSMIRSKDLGVQVENVNLPDQPFRALVRYKNISKVYLQIVKIGKAQLDTVQNQSQRNGNHDHAFLKYFKSKQVFKRSEFNLPEAADHQTHATEVPVPALPAGIYLIAAGTDSSLSGSKQGLVITLTQVSNISYLYRNGNDGQKEILLLHRDSGKPLPMVNVRLLNPRTNGRPATLSKVNYVSDASGIVRINGLNESDQSLSFALAMSLGGDVLYTSLLQNWLYQYSDFSIYREHRSVKPNIRSYLYSDRAIYRPGQQVFFKGIVLDISQEKTPTVLLNHGVTVTLMDANYQKVSEVNLVTNEFGSYQVSFTLPSGLLNGRMSLQDNYNHHSILVEEYKRPKFELKLSASKPTYRVGDTVATLLQVRSFAGPAIANAQGQYRVVRRVNIPWRDGWTGRSMPRTPELQLAHGSFNTNHVGEASISFKALADATLDSSLRPVFAYTVYVSVTDGTGESQTIEEVISLAYNSFSLRLELPAVLLSSQIQSFKVKALNARGENVNSKGTVKIVKLAAPMRATRDRLWERPDQVTMTKEKYHQLFPYDIYQEEQLPENWPEQEVVSAIPFETGSEGAMLSSPQGLKPGKYKISVLSVDSYNQIVAEVGYVDVVDPRDDLSPYPNTGYFYSLSTVAEPGTTALTMYGASEKINVYYHLLQGDQVLDNRHLDIDGSKSLALPIQELHRGNLQQVFEYVLHNRFYRFSKIITVPYTNKVLDVTVGSFRDKVTPGVKEEWKVQVRTKKGEKSMAELLAFMYDASLDQFAKNEIDFSPFPTFYASNFWTGEHVIGTADDLQAGKDMNPTINYNPVNYDELNWFRFPDNRTFLRNQRAVKSAPFSRQGQADMEALESKIVSPAITGESASPPDAQSEEGAKQQASGDLTPVRRNFNETAFFYPQLKTDAEGSTVVSFTMPDALTRWKFLGLTHTRQLEYSILEKEITTQKDLMITSNPPRFVREGDTITVTAKADNLTNGKITAQATLQFYDAITKKSLDVEFQNKVAPINMTIPENGSEMASWNLRVPKGISAVSYKVMVKGQGYTDAEEILLPILSNKALITETLPLHIRSGETKTFTLTSLKDGNAVNNIAHKLTLEYTSNPAWYAVQALPYLSEGNNGSADQLFYKLYADALAKQIIAVNPSIKQTFDVWKLNSSNALLSNLQKNDDVKNVLLQETPWVAEGQTESENKQRLALLFDDNRIKQVEKTNIDKLVELQLPDGSWPWFPNMPGNHFITQNIVSGFGHLRQLGIGNLQENYKAWQALRSAIGYIDKQVEFRFKEATKASVVNSKRAVTAGNLDIYYLYARSFFVDVDLPAQVKKAIAHYKSLLVREWITYSPYMKGMSALAMYRLGDKALAQQIISSLREQALHSEELGMYFKSNQGYYWYQAPVETQALLIEAFQEIAQDTLSVEQMKIWLLKNKQTNAWPTSKATAEACYALLIDNGQLNGGGGTPAIEVGKTVVDVPGEMKEAGTGYFKKSWSAAEITSDMGTVALSQQGKGISWGALYWQYFQEIDKVKLHKTPLAIKKQLYIQNMTGSGKQLVPLQSGSNVKIGDLLTVRIEIIVDRDMEFMHLKDLRSAGLEPVQVISQYKYQGGLGYYETSKDASVSFFIDYLPKGTYVFEYPLRATHAGKFSNGFTEMQCLYAPEFLSRSEGTRLTVNKEK